MPLGTSTAGPSRTDRRGGSSPAARGRWRAQRGGGGKISLLIPCRAEPLLDLPRACRGGRRPPPPCFARSPSPALQGRNQKQLRGRGDREAADRAVPLDEARDQTVLLRLLDKVAQEGKAGGVLFWRTDRLLHGGELAVENARAGELRGDIDEPGAQPGIGRSEEHTSELQSPDHLVCRLLLEKKKK